MNRTEARTMLLSMVQADSKPLLTTGEIGLLMDIAAQVDAYGTAPETYEVWSGAHVYPLNSKAVPSEWNGYWYKVSGAGTSAGFEPNWPTLLGSSVVDGTTTWLCAGYSYWEPEWNLSLAAAEGWDWKAGKVVAQYDVQAGAVEAMRSQIYKHCIAQRDRYRGMARGGGSIGWIQGTTQE